VEAQQAVRELLSKLSEDEWLDQKTIRAEAGVHSGLAYKGLQTLVDSGEVEREGAGKHGNPYRYRLARFVPPPAPEDPVEPCFVVFTTSNEKQLNNESNKEIEVRAVCEQCGREEAAHTSDDPVCGNWTPIWRGEV
jgi:hypothetical protein